MATHNEDSKALEEWTSTEAGSVYKVDDSDVTTPTEAASHINTLLKEIGAYNV